MWRILQLTDEVRKLGSNIMGYEKETEEFCLEQSHKILKVFPVSGVEQFEFT